MLTHRLTHRPTSTKELTRLAADVHFLEEDGIGRLFDLHRAQFFALNPTGTRLLQLTLAHGAGKAASIVADECGMAEDQVSDDLTGMLEQLRKNQLLDEPGTRKASTPIAWFVRGLKRGTAWAMRTWWAGGTIDAANSRHLGRLLKLAWLSLRILGWRRSAALWCVAVDQTKQSDQRFDHVTFDQTLRSSASAQLLLPCACKERALVAAYCLRRNNQPAKLVVGVQRHPFAAHAWVECDGQILTDDPAHCGMFTRLTSYE